MRLTNSQAKQVHVSLLSAFSIPGKLAELVRFHLGPNLEHIATGNNASEIAFKLIQWAEENGCVQDLISGMFEEAPRNRYVSDLFENSRMWFETAQSTNEMHKLDFVCYGEKVAILVCDGCFWQNNQRNNSVLECIRRRLVSRSYSPLSIREMSRLRNAIDLSYTTMLLH